MRSPLYFPLREALEKGTECLLCVIEEGLEHRYMKYYLSELVMDPPSRDKVVESRGFCNYHLHQMLAESTRPEISAGTGIALVMESIVEALIKDLKTQQDYVEKNVQAGKRSFAASILLFLKNAKARLYHPMGQESFLVRETQRMLRNTSRCPACLHQSSFAETYATEFVETLAGGDAEFRRLFEESKGLCVPHYVTTVGIAEKKLDSKGRETIKMIVDVEAKNLKRLSSEFREYIRKHDYRFSGETWGPERDVLARGVAKLVGKLGLAAPSAGETLQIEKIIDSGTGRAAEHEKLRMQNTYLTSKNEELTKRSLQLGSELAALHYKAYELFNDNRVLVMRVSGLRAENESFRKMLEEHGLVQPVSTAEAKQEEGKLRERYLFSSKRG
ncbi:MAG: DUF6062 family protein [Candidatus Bathyarchaeia archaeon]